MNIYYRGKLVGYWKVLKHLPHARKEAKKNNFGIRFHLVLIKRLAQSRYWDKHAEQQTCGCFKVGNHFTSYMMDCDLHGIDAIFDEYDQDYDSGGKSA